MIRSLFISLYIIGATFVAQVIFNATDTILTSLGTRESVVNRLNDFWPLLFLVLPLVAVILCLSGKLPDLGEESNRPKRFWIYVAVITLVVHSFFCVQAYLPLKQGGMVSEGPWLWFYYPHYILIFFSPPAYPLNGGQINYFHFWGKMLVALPASIVYALLVVGLGMEIGKMYRAFVWRRKP